MYYERRRQAEATSVTSSRAPLLHPSDPCHSIDSGVELLLALLKKILMRKSVVRLFQRK